MPVLGPAGENGPAGADGLAPHPTTRVRCPGSRPAHDPRGRCCAEVHDDHVRAPGQAGVSRRDRAPQASWARRAQLPCRPRKLRVALQVKQRAPGADGPAFRPGPCGLYCPHARLVPRLPDDLRRGDAVPCLRPAPDRGASGAVRADHRASRLRRVLCECREAGRSFAPRPARHHRRGTAGRRVHRLLHRPDQGRALRDADVQGAEALPRGGGRAGPDGPLCGGVAAGPRDDGRADAHRGAAVARRGVPRSWRHAAAASCGACGDARAAGAADGAGAGDHGVHRAVAQQVPRQGGVRPRQAAGVFGDREGARPPRSCATGPCG